MCDVEISEVTPRPLRSIRIQMREKYVSRRRCGERLVDLFIHLFKTYVDQNVTRKYCKFEEDVCVTLGVKRARWVIQPLVDSG